jgi:hypothetical protein
MDSTKSMLEYLDIDTMHFRSRVFIYDRGGFLSRPSLLFYCEQLPHFFHVAYLDEESKFYKQAYGNEPEKTTHIERYSFYSKYKCDLLFSICGLYHALFAFKNNNN